jgi:acetyl-CoA carboxylase carboxyltransferase component
MSSKHLRGDINYAWPTAEIAVMGARAAVEIIYGRELSQSADPAAFLAEKERSYAERFTSPLVAARRGYIDDIISPSRTRLRVIKALTMLEHKQDSNPRKKHANMPL